MYQNFNDPVIIDKDLISIRSPYNFDFEWDVDYINADKELAFTPDHNYYIYNRTNGQSRIVEPTPSGKIFLTIDESSDSFLTKGDNNLELYRQESNSPSLDRDTRLSYINIREER